MANIAEKNDDKNDGHGGTKRWRLCFFLLQQRGNNRTDPQKRQCNNIDNVAAIMAAGAATQRQRGSGSGNGCDSDDDNGDRNSNTELTRRQRWQ